MKKRLCFMGTPQFAAAILEELLLSDHEVVLVVSQPDRKTGRKQLLTETAVKACALRHGITVLQPDKIGEIKDELERAELDLIVTCAYGQFIPQSILNLPRYGAVNVHASLLPKYRGGAPIHRAIYNGEPETGITLMRMAKKMDAGDILFQDKVRIDLEDDLEAVQDKLVRCGREMVRKYLNELLRDGVSSIPQDEDQVSFAYNIGREEEKIDFSRSAQDVLNHIRAFHPSPVAYGEIQSKKLKIYRAKMASVVKDGKAGEILGFEEDGLLVACGDGVIVLLEVQLEGKSKMSAQAFYQGVGKQWIGVCFE